MQNHYTVAGVPRANNIYCIKDADIHITNNTIQLHHFFCKGTLPLYKHSRKKLKNRTRLTSENISSNQQPDREGQYSLHRKKTARRPTNQSYGRLRIRVYPIATIRLLQEPMPEKEKKKIIYVCPKFLGMKYTPLPLSEAAMPAVCKNNAALYGIQMALANMTRPIGDYVHKKLKNPAISIKGNDDLKSAHLMQELLSDVVSNIAQTKIKYIHKLIELPVKHPKSFQQKTEAKREVLFVCASRMRMTQHLQRRIPLKLPPKSQPIQRITPRYNLLRFELPGPDSQKRVGQKHSGKGIQDSVQKSEFGEVKRFDEKKLYKFKRNACEATYPGEIKYFYKERQNLVSYDLPLTLHPHSYKLKMNKEASQRNPQVNCSSFSKECNRAGKEHNTQVLQPVIYHTKKDRVLAPCFRSQETQQLRRAEKIQNVITDIHMQDNHEKRLHGVLKSRRNLYAYSDTSEMQEISFLSMK
ncbi:hypothetical protein BB561_004980 [Smittium simulii]|uniref:Uncharacterized protein n=1 Tax=Smittium simulii TaxID=133385 RepID=A0A2T9YCZ1_9FUNG|nr:hypothetical protein BB561_004980 [Smittium simulii]